MSRAGSNGASGLITLALIVVGLIGCQATHAPSPEAPASLTPKVVSQLEGTSQSATSSAQSEGHLAFIAADGNVYVITADRTSQVAITNDATAPWEGAGLSYQRISWSPHGQLAFASVTRRGDEAQSQLFVTEAPGQPARVVGYSDDHFVIYIYWSPAPCSGRPTCRQLAYLIEEHEDIGLRVVTMDGGEVENRVVGLGWPFYFSWHPAGQSILWHTGDLSNGNLEVQLALYDLGNDETHPLPQSPGSFLAPAWSPQGDQWLSVVADGAQDQLQSSATERPIPLPAGASSEIGFVWAPDGRQIAYAVRQQDSDPFYGPIQVFDLHTGTSKRITDVGLRILAFFWSPAGQQLGYITWLPLGDADWMQWRVYDLVQAKDRGFKAFNPSLQMRFVMSSFNQYAQSHRFWSPDGRYLVYANRDERLKEERIWLINTWDEDGNNSILVGEGPMGFWSWN